MSRRSFILGVTSSSFLALGLELGSRPYELNFKLVPKHAAKRKFSNPEDFFKFYGSDAAGSSLNTFFINRGWLKNIDVRLCPNGKEVLVKKVYRSKFYKTLYSSLWASISGRRSDESKKYFQVKMQPSLRPKAIS